MSLGMSNYHDKCPLQLGCSHMAELTVFGDSCCNGVRSFTNMIGRACSCGQISFKNHKHKTIGVGDQILEERRHDLFLRNLKQLAIERFLGGGIERVLRGHLESITTDGRLHCVSGTSGYWAPLGCIKHSQLDVSRTPHKQRF